MQTSKFRVAVGALIFLSTALWADTLTFIAQPGLGGSLDYSWFNSANWFSSDAQGNLNPAGHVPLADEGAVITGMVDAGGGGIRVQSLLATNSAIITNGTFAVQQLEMRGGSSFNNSSINLLTTLIISGTNCQVNASVLTIFATASATFQSVPPAPAATLILDRGAILRNNSVVTLTAGSQILGGGVAPQSQLIISSGSLVIATNQTLIQGSAANHLVVDNSGTIRCDGGTLNFGGGLDWQAGSGTGEFQAASSNALMLFVAPFHVDGSVFDSFTGPGKSRWLAGATVDGTAQVAGNLEVLDSVFGLGTIQVTGLTAEAGVLTWINGTFGIAQIGIDAGANLVLGGDAGTIRQLAGCTINNAGSCYLVQGDLGFSGGASVSNRVGGTLDFQATHGLTLSVTGGTALVDNAGTVRNSGGGTVQFGATGLIPGPDFNNHGLVDLGAGQLNLLAGTSSGEFRTADAAKLWFWGGTHTLTTGVTFTGNGAVELREGVTAARWRILDAIRVPRLDVGTNGVVDAASSISTNATHFDELTMSANGTLREGKFEISALSMLDQSTVTNSSVDVLNQLNVQGANCSLRSSTVRTAPGAGGMLGSFAQPEPAHLFLVAGSILENDGDLDIVGGAQITGTTPPQSQVILAPGALVIVTNASRIQGTSTNHLVLVNDGRIFVRENSRLLLEDTVDCKTGPGTGVFLALAQSSTIEFAAPFRAESGATAIFSGSGTNRWLAGAMLDGVAQVGNTNAPFFGLLPEGNLEVLDSVSGNGSLIVSGASALPGVFTWINGTISCPTLTIQSNGYLNILDAPGSSRHLSHCQVNNSGQFLWLSKAGLSAGGGAAINNLPTGVLDMQTDTTLSFDNVPPSLNLNNAGTFTKSGGIGVTPLDADFKNSGNFSLRSGTLNFGGVWVQTEGSSGVDASTVLKTGTMGVLGGRLTGSGTIEATLNNASVVSPGTSPGILTITSGKDYQQSPVGTFKVEIGGPIPGAQYDRLAVGGKAGLAGRLQVSLINGFVPKPGDAFEVLTSSAGSGSFANVDPTGIPGTYWAPFYNGTNVVLVLRCELRLLQPVISGNSLQLPFSTMPGLVYLVQATDTFSPPNWQTIDTVPGDGTVHITTDSLTPTQRFYRLTLQ